MDRPFHAAEADGTREGSPSTAAADARAGSGDAETIEARLAQLIAARGDGPPADPPGRAADDTSKRILLGPAVAAPEQFQSRLGKMLIDDGLITAAELDDALARQRTTGERLGEALVAMGVVSSAHVAGVLAQHLRMPFIDLHDHVGDDSALTAMISSEVAYRYVALPVARWGDRIVIAMATPNDSYLVDELRLLVDAPVVVAVADPTALRRAITTTYGERPAALDEEPAPLSPTEEEPRIDRLFTCPGCNQQLGLYAEPWVMIELNRDAGRYYVWDREPAGNPPAHACARAGSARDSGA